MMSYECSSVEECEGECRGRDGEVDIAAGVLHEGRLTEDATDCLHHLPAPVGRLKTRSFAHTTYALPARQAQAR